MSPQTQQAVLSLVHQDKLPIGYLLKAIGKSGTLLLKLPEFAIVHNKIDHLLCQPVATIEGLPYRITAWTVFDSQQQLVQIALKGIDDFFTARTLVGEMVFLERSLINDLYFKEKQLYHFSDYINLPKVSLLGFTVCLVNKKEKVGVVDLLLFQKNSLLLKVIPYKEAASAYFWVAWSGDFIESIDFKAEEIMVHPEILEAAP